uniref:Phorbol-ester/DAG-type domain-containing protein n=1 Tax=Panagrellus redivivus TaxID=6233 RepID=A0A7E4V764_PANRE
MSIHEDDSGLGSDLAESEVFNTDYKQFLQNQIDAVLTSEREKQSGLDRREELHIAIDLCKKKIVEMDESDDAKRQQILDLMVELRLELEQVEEIQAKDPAASVTRWQGHEFVLQSLRGRNPYCETCVSTIWRIAQAWRRCIKCGFRTHDKCVKKVNDKCAAWIVGKPGFEFDLRICPEKTLLSQNYECFSCNRAISYESGSDAEPRLCDYTGQYYCKKCHWNDNMIIPARVVRNWDFQPRVVCRSVKKLLITASKKPIIQLEKLNPALPSYIHSVSEICKLRKQILLMKCFFLCCRSARNLRILQHLNRYQHFVESSDRYTMEDLIALHSGNLLQEIQDIVKIFRKHITEECETCRGNAFVCELCSNKETIYPFDDSASTCRTCCAVFHKTCFSTASRRCPRCARREARKCAILAEMNEDGQDKN